LTDHAAQIDPAVIAKWREKLPRAFGRPAHERAMILGGWLIFLSFVAHLLILFDMTPARLWNGLGRLADILSQMVPPTADGHFPDLLSALLETIAIAFLGTVGATLLAIPVGFLGAKNVAPAWVFHFSLRRMLDGIRGIDQLIWALVFVRAVGLGPLAGVLAVLVSDFGTLAKLFAEAVENAEKKQIEGVTGTGAANVLVIRFGIWPQVLPVFLSQALYFFESNVRSATILGIVGAGGIGLQLSERIKVRAWDQVLFVILMILVTVAVIDLVSRVIRERVIGGRAQH